MIEHFFQCPYCWEEISMLVETAQSDQQYIEDCEVCCQPIQILVRTDNSDILSFDSRKVQ